MRMEMICKREKKAKAFLEEYHVPLRILIRYFLILYQLVMIIGCNPPPPTVFCRPLGQTDGQTYGRVQILFNASHVPWLNFSLSKAVYFTSLKYIYLIQNCIYNIPN